MKKKHVPYLAEQYSTPKVQARPPSLLLTTLKKKFKKKTNCIASMTEFYQNCINQILLERSSALKLFSKSGAWIPSTIRGPISHGDVIYSLAKPSKSRKHLWIATKHYRWVSPSVLLVENYKRWSNNSIKVKEKSLITFCPSNSSDCQSVSRTQTLPQNR